MAVSEDRMIDESRAAVGLDLDPRTCAAEPALEIVGADHHVPPGGDAGEQARVVEALASVAVAEEHDRVGALLRRRRVGVGVQGGRGVVLGRQDALHGLREGRGLVVAEFRVAGQGVRVGGVVDGGQALTEDRAGRTEIEGRHPDRVGPAVLVGEVERRPGCVDEHPADDAPARPPPPVRVLRTDDIVPPPVGDRPDTTPAVNGLVSECARRLSLEPVLYLGPRIRGCS